MHVEFADERLARLEIDPAYTGGFSAEIVSAYRKRLWFIRQAMDERDLYQMKGQRFEKLKGSRAHQRSMRLNKQWRLILAIVAGTPERTVRVIGIVL
jgi:proteic killer suppression protein